MSTRWSTAFSICKISPSAKSPGRWRKWSRSRRRRRCAKPSRSRGRKTCRACRCGKFVTENGAWPGCWTSARCCIARRGGETPLREAIALAREKTLSRLPVWEIRDGKRRVAGLLDIGPLLYRETLDVEKPASAYMFPAVFVNEGIRLEVALRLMQRAGQRMAIVLSRERAEIGIVAVKDILKVMFGEMKL